MSRSGYRRRGAGSLPLRWPIREVARSVSAMLEFSVATENLMTSSLSESYDMMSSPCVRPLDHGEASWFEAYLESLGGQGPFGGILRVGCHYHGSARTRDGCDVVFAGRPAAGGAGDARW